MKKKLKKKKEKLNLQFIFKLNIFYSKIDK